MNDTTYEIYEEPELVFRDWCKECGMPVGQYGKWMLCDICAEAMMEESEETYDVG